MPRSSSPTADLGRHLAARRRALGLTVEEVAARAGLAPATVRNVEAGRPAHKHRASCLAAVADAVELPSGGLTAKLRPDTSDSRALLAEVRARRLRGGPYGGPAARLRGRLVTSARGADRPAAMSGTPRPSVIPGGAQIAGMEDIPVSPSPTPES